MILMFTYTVRHEHKTNNIRCFCVSTVVAYFKQQYSIRTMCTCIMILSAMVAFSSSLSLSLYGYKRHSSFAYILQSTQFTDALRALCFILNVSNILFLPCRQIHSCTNINSFSTLNGISHVNYNVDCYNDFPRKYRKYSVRIVCTNKHEEFAI